MTIQEHVPLAPLTTFRVGGEARFFVAAESKEDVIAALAFARAQHLPVFILGGGSNILVADTGFEGLVIALAIKGITFGDEGVVTAGAGVVWDDLITATIEKGLAGFECLSGVPGSVGGAVVANAGCYGAQCSTTFVSAEVIDLQNQDDALQILKKEDCDFSYHDSLFAKNPGRYLILNATFALATDGVPRSAYKDSRFDLSAMTQDLGHVPTLSEVRNIVLDVREQKGTVIMEGRLSFKSAGSFFHMLTVSESEYAKITARAMVLNPQLEERLRPWAWKQPDGTYRVASAFLLEFTEFPKGFVRGSVGVSPKHQLSIINLGGAHASEIAELARDMRSSVKELFNVDLEHEVEYVGNVEETK